MKQEYKNILLIKMSSLGDVIHTLPFVNELRKLYPDAKIMRNTLSPIIGAHTGPGMIAICFISPKESSDSISGD